MQRMIGNFGISGYHPRHGAMSPAGDAAPSPGVPSAPEGQLFSPAQRMDMCFSSFPFLLLTVRGACAQKRLRESLVLPLPQSQLHSALGRGEEESTGLPNQVLFQWLRWLGKIELGQDVIIRVKKWGFGGEKQVIEFFRRIKTCRFSSSICLSRSRLQIWSIFL